MNLKTFLIFLIFAIIITGVISFLVSSSPDENHSQSASMSSNLDDNQNKPEDKTLIRKPKMAGQFYPAGKEELNQQIDQFLAKAELPEVKRQVKGLVLPHAGYVFSGEVIAYGAKALQNQEIERVILIGPSHNVLIDKVALDDNDKWQTPLGEVDVDISARQELIQKSSLFETNSEAHISEHSLEVELPFLQKTISNDFKILPILLGYDLNQKDLDKISRLLKEYLNKKTIIIASTDLSHYPDYQTANKVDQKTIKAILSGDTKRLDQIVNNLENNKSLNLSTALCGKEAVQILMQATADNVKEIKLLKYSNTGDVSIGNKSNVVGYGSIVFLGDKSNLPKAADDQK